MFFLANKHETFDEFVKFCKIIQEQIDFETIKFRSDHGKEFENGQFSKFCDEHGIVH